jgi:histone acetyltransferase (RNA polymerase elongator complex component)
MAKTLRKFIVPIFISNQGCPHRCIFCDQKKITGEGKPEPELVEKNIKVALNSKRYKKEQGIEVAFYGGTFASLPVPYMKRLLEPVRRYIEKGIVSGIRISTRPDSINKEILSILKEYGVETVELGAQSLDDNVLRLSKRGHTAEDVFNSFQLLKAQGFKVGIQLMPGLPGDTKEVFRVTIQKTIELAPDMVRLYPTVVIKGTELEELYKKKLYRPLSLQEAVDICSEAVITLESKGIPVIRIGLMNSASLTKNIVAGPWHPAFGFLVRSTAFIKDRVVPLLKKGNIKNEAVISIHSRLIPLLKGYKNEGIRIIEAETGIKIKQIRADESLLEEKIKVEAA